MAALDQPAPANAVAGVGGALKRLGRSSDLGCLQRVHGSLPSLQAVWATHKGAATLPSIHVNESKSFLKLYNKG